MAKFRARLHGRDRELFDFICAAGQFGYSLPDKEINMKWTRWARDPRKRLAREFPHLHHGRHKSCRYETWAKAGDRIARLLVKELGAKNISEETRALRVLMNYVTIALAPDCKVPSDPVPRAAWRAMVKMFAKLFPSNVQQIDSADYVKPYLSIMKREAARGLQIGRRASGKRAGRCGRELAIDPKFVALAGKALGKEMKPAFVARYLFYTKTGDHFWPHPDDPKVPVTVLLCLSHKAPPKVASRSAFLAYWPNGNVKRYEIAPGNALAIEPGRIHAREPLRRGERVALLSIGLRPARALPSRGKTG